MVRRAQERGALKPYEPRLLQRLIVAVVNEMWQQILLPGPFPLPTSLISAMFLAAELGHDGG